MRRFCKQGTDLLRRTAILLPMALLTACGGGGGGGTPAAGGGGGGGGMQVRLEALPPVFIPSDAVMAARQLTGGVLPETEPTPAELEMKVVDIAGMSDALLFSEMAAVGDLNASRMIMCTPGVSMCTAVIDDGMGGEPMMQMHTPDDIDGPVLFHDEEVLTGWNDAYDIVMTDRGIPLVQMRAAGRDDAGMRFEYQGYGGWLEHSVFLIQEQTAMMQGMQVSSIAAYSFGKATGTNPTRRARWDGVMVGVANGGDIIQGDATVQWDSDTPNMVSGLFNSIQNLSDEVPYATALITWRNIPLENGAFTSDDAFVNVTGSISGYFYGGNDQATAPPEVGGIFNAAGIFGAFGANK